MDAAEMIQEEKLKKGFMLATLISTIAGTFITGFNLYDRVADQRRQHKMDKGQNKKIKDLEARLNQAVEEKKQIVDARDDRDRGKRSKKRRDSDDDDDDDSDDDRPLRRSLEYGGTSIQREFDRYFRSMGQKFAKGDLVGQTQLQSQIIILQSNIIKLLEEALSTGNPPDINKLYNTSEFARQGSIRALQDQYQRFLQQQQSPQRLRRPGGPVRRISSTPSLRGSDVPNEPGWNASRALPAPGPPSSIASTGTGTGNSPLFCRYAKSLQHNPNQPLDPSDQCPSCRAILFPSHAPQPSWRIKKRVIIPQDHHRGRDGRSSSRSRRFDDDAEEEEDVVTKSFILTPRFIAKCHRPIDLDTAPYACYLCFCNRERDTLCRSEESLVNHVAAKHGLDEYFRDGDVKELRERRSLAYR